ncbi:hypothetical protein TVAG_050260 [Trichomonas vaginalis G3]|uniref:Rab-GAP TBC domain-containing protein n=1 Tax=Trichomonas vaginalis (strain ATCC PRA-98 / G3) TaxID=412133 RepID=A2EJF4_TRIV3|nr:regulation of vesicle fusion [Trichomonas vaginalis G3]EAY07211.1 hypothetical protein TVAG_050260 [Trichomonas vaginalis G3]KAI5533899.1 regulation of vesicle fusion [Trichomonas vaginalis G3]|eukprot:XP_001319434.1 hypothetical protein [Trichomonas vaginalis G3]
MSKKELDFIIFPLVQPNPEETPIDKTIISTICEQTLEDYPPEDRALAWMVMLGLYPSNPNKWESEKRESIQNYWQFVDEFGVRDWHTKTFDKAHKQQQFDVPNKPLMHQIFVDILRTARQIMFFPPEEPNPNSLLTPDLAPFEGYMRRIERVLYVFANFNVGLSYTQGFNELVTPMYYVLLKSTHLFRNNQDDIEGLAFTMLQLLITSTPIHEMYTTQDKSSIILHKLSEFTDILKRHIPTVHNQLEALNIHPATYCYKWFNLLFAQEYDMPSILPIWDLLFAHVDEILEYAFYFGVAQIKIVEDRLIGAKFSVALQALQNLQIGDPGKCIKLALEYYEKDHKVSFKEKFKSFFRSSV